MVAGVWWHQERLAYQPPLRWPLPPSDVRKIEYVAADEQRLFAFVIEPDTEVAGVLVAFHGNADLAVWQIPWAREVARHTAWAVFLAEYRGYGGLDGTPTYATIAEDARAAWKAALTFTHQRLAARTPALALYGHSLGSGVAAELAVEIEANPIDPIMRAGSVAPEPLAALVLQSPFTTARDMTRIISAPPVQLLWRLISRVHYDTRECLNGLRAPVSIAHGSRDWLVPLWMGRELFACARTPGCMLVIDGAGHNDVAEVGAERYWNWLADALSGRREDPREALPTHRTETPD